MKTIEIHQSEFTLIHDYLKQRFFKQNYLKEYFIDYAEYDDKEARIYQTYEQIEIIGGLYTFEYDISILYKYMENYEEWMVWSKDISFQTLYKNEDEVLGLTQVQKNILTSLITNLIDARI